MNTDRSFFSIICDHGTGIYQPEHELQDMTFDEIVSDVDSGQIENVLHIFEFNPAEGWSREVTADVVAAVKQMRKPSLPVSRSPIEFRRDWRAYQKAVVNASAHTRTAA